MQPKRYFYKMAVVSLLLTTNLHVNYNRKCIFVGLSPNSQFNHFLNLPIKCGEIAYSLVFIAPPVPNSNPQHCYLYRGETGKMEFFFYVLPDDKSLRNHDALTTELYR